MRIGVQCVVKRLVAMQHKHTHPKLPKLSYMFENLTPNCRGLVPGLQHSQYSQDALQPIWHWYMLHMEQRQRPPTPSGGVRELLV
jgi:hypothetical protein